VNSEASQNEQRLKKALKQAIAAHEAAESECFQLQVNVCGGESDKTLAYLLAVKNLANITQEYTHALVNLLAQQARYPSRRFFA